MAAHVSSQPAKSIFPSPSSQSIAHPQAKTLPRRNPSRAIAVSCSWRNPLRVSRMAQSRPPPPASPFQPSLGAPVVLGTGFFRVAPSEGRKNPPESSSEHLWLCSHWGISLFLGLIDWENLGPGMIPHQAGLTHGLFTQGLRPSSPVAAPQPWRGGTPGSSGAVRKDISGLLIRAAQKNPLELPTR